jgi:hypothetical protein
MSEIACKLDPGGRGQRQQVLVNLVARATVRRESDGGYAFGFPAEATTLAEVAAVVEPERRCCPFLRIALTAEPDDGPIRLDLTGPDGTKEFLRGLLNLA